MTRAPMPLRPLALRKAAQRGLTLVELMVAMTISLLVVASVSMLFLNTRVSQRATDERSQMRETGLAALELLGRYIGNAGFYPSITVEEGLADGANQKQVLQGYESALGLMLPAGAPVGIANGIYGCSQGVPRADLNGCAAVSGTNGKADSDGLSVAFYSSDALSLDAGWRSDCTRADIGTDAIYNTARIQVQTEANPSNVARTATEGLAPALPLLSINQFFLRPISMVNDAGAQINTFALSCRGNGRRSPAGTGAMLAVTLLPGIEQLVVRYGVARTAGVAAASAYVDAAAVGADEWPKVVSVRVCVLVRSLSAGVVKASGNNNTDCLGNTIASSTAMFEAYTRMFTVKNRLNETVKVNL